MSAQNTTTYNVEVTDGGSTEKVISKIETLIGKLRNAQNEAKQGINTGGTTGSRSLSESAMSGSTYGKLRASGTGTGAASRDFAKESQGLGGLVRLYATYAANVFAVGAAFSALSNAMNTTNMIKSLDQLGANSGKSLGSLSKRVVDLTDGAISLQDAMTAVAQSSSAGLSSKNIERLAGVAKNASLALGITMPDAISRLSRGITKLEPELLDELGIFTKIEPAVDAYARQVGKTASQLTDFEKRQAFANAVLKEGEDKFKSLAELSANPYDKLLASLKNLAQVTLDFVNKALGPFIDLLSSNPTLLATAVAGLGVALLKQALPAIGQFKEELKSSADFAAQLATSKAADAEVARSKVSALIEQEAERRANIQVQAVDDAEARINELRKKSYAKDSATAKALAKDLDDLKPRDFAKMEREAKDYANKGLHAEAEAVRDVSYALEQSKKAEYELRVEKGKNIIAIENEKTGRSQYALTLEAADKAQIESTKRKIVSDAAYNTSLIGMGHAYTLLSADIEKSGLQLDKFDKTMLKLRGTVGIMAGVLASLGNALNAALGWIGLIISAFSIIDAILSKDSKAFSTFNGAVDQSNDSLTNMNRTLEVLAKKGNVAGASIEGISALANSTLEARDTLEKLISTSEKAKEALGDSRWARIKDNFASFFGGGVQNNLAEGVAKQVTGSLKIFERAGTGQEAQEKLKKALGVNSLDFQTVEAAAKSLDKEGLQKLQKTTDELNTNLNNSASRLQSFKAASDTALKGYQDFLKSTASSSPLFKLGDDISALSDEMVNLKEKGVNQLQAGLIELATNPKKAGLFSQEFFTQLTLAKQGFLEQVAAVEKNKDRLVEVRSEIEKYKKALPQGYDFAADTKNYASDKGGMNGLANKYSGRTEAVEQLRALTEEANKLELEIKIPEDKAKAIRDLWNKGINDALILGADYIQKALGQASERAAITIGRAQSTVFTGAEKARIETKLNQQEISMQTRLIDSNIRLILQGERNTAATEALTAALALETAAKQGVTDPDLQKLIKAAQAASIISKGLGTTEGSKPNFAVPEGLDKETETQVRTRFNRVNRLVAEQQASRKDQQAKSAANTFTGAVNERKGELEDNQKLEALQSSITAAKLQQLQIADSIVGYATKETIAAEAALENQNNELKRKQEIDKIDQDILNVSKADISEDRRSQLIKLAKLKTTTLTKQEIEAQVDSQKRLNQEIQAEIEVKNRARELAKSSRDLANEEASARLEVTAAQASSYATLFDNSKQYTNSLQNQNELQRIQQDYDSKVTEEFASINAKREDAQIKLNKLNATDVTQREEITKELKRQENLFKNNLGKLDAEKDKRQDILEITKQQQAVQVAIDKLNKQFELKKSNTQVQNAIADNALEAEQLKLDVQKTYAREFDTYIVKQQTALDLKKAEKATSQQILALQDELNNKRNLSTTKVTALVQSGAAEQDVAKLQTDETEYLKQQSQLTDNEITKQNLALENTKAKLAVQQQLTLEQIKYNEMLSLSNELSTNLKDTFGLFGDKVKAVGEALGDTVTRLTENNIRQEKFSKAQVEDQKKLDALKGDSSADEQSIIDLQNKMADDKKKNNKEELKGDLAAISSTKKMFKEKTAAYKIFAAVEKALALAQVATNVMVLASKLTTEAGTTAAAVGGTTARLPAYITDIWGQTLGKLPFPIGGIVGAGLVALLLSSFGGKGGSSKAPPMVTAEMRQETQGTAMGYNAAGEKVQVRRGVFGDETAKSESINNSLKIIAENSVDGLDYDNKMLNALKGLRDALTESAQALFGVKGLRSGTAFGTVEGANSSGGWFGISGLFGKTTTRSIIDSGIKIAGTFSELARAGNGVIQTFETVSTTTKSSGFLGIGSSSKTSVGTNFGMLDPKAEAALRNAFDYAGDLLYSIGEKAGKLPAEIERGMAGVKVDELVSLRGLTGEDFNKALSNVIGAVLDDATLAIFSEFEKFAKFGEGMLQTVVRVVDTNTKVNQAIKNIGTSISGQMQQAFLDVTENSTFFGLITGSYATWKTRTVDIDKLTNDITEALVKASDGLDNFLDKVENFRSNFLTEAEQLEPINKAYRKGLTDLGYSADISREELKGLIQNFDLFNPAAGRAGKSTAETYTLLLDIASGFDKVADAAESAAKKISDERQGLVSKLDQLRLTAEQLQDIDISKLDSTNQALQRQIFAMQDMQTAAKTLQTRLNDVTKTMKSQITSLTDYKQSLMIGDKSTLTAVDQYQLAKKNLTELYQTATSTTATEEQRNTALGKLQGASDQVLTLSRQLYNSSAQYSVDQALVLGYIDATKADLEKRKTDVQLQLDELQSSNNFLKNIDANSKTTSDLIADYLASINTYNTAATNAGDTQLIGIPKLAQGTNYVPYNMVAEIHRGERIIPAADNQQLVINNTQMVQEIKLLNEKIGNLQQAIIDGAVINAQATNRNTEEIAAAIGVGADRTIQSTRLQTRAVIK